MVDTAHDRDDLGRNDVPAGVSGVAVGAVLALAIPAVTGVLAPLAISGGVGAAAILAARLVTRARSPDHAPRGR